MSLHRSTESQSVCGKNNHFKATYGGESPAGSTQQPVLRLIAGPNVQIPLLQNALWHRLKNTTVTPETVALRSANRDALSFCPAYFSVLSVWSSSVSPHRYQLHRLLFLHFFLAVKHKTAWSWIITNFPRHRYQHRKAESVIGMSSSNRFLT